MTNPKMKALAKLLDVSVNELDESKHDENSFESGREDYLVYTDEEADEAAREAILESIWAFTPTFLAAHMPDLDVDDIKQIQKNGRCDDNNKLFIKLLGDVGYFVKDAVLSDGRGHFLSGYDGEENEAAVDGVTYYIYRTN